MTEAAPDYEELADALRCLALAYGGRHVRDGLEAIGLGPDATQYVRGKPYDTKEAFEVLARLEDRLGETARADMYRNQRGNW
jgi:hypothetical protein|uniref:Uncharacterized protein n=1 Tax=viral metagenome TaxID=1070528 RepID=A0A6H1ZBG7_9ZZZZ